MEPHYALAARKTEVVDRAAEVSELLNAVEELLIPFIRSADEDLTTKDTGHGIAINNSTTRTTLVENLKPNMLVQLLNFVLPDAGQGKDGLLKVLQSILKYSVNTWDQGFLDKLYASTNAVGVASELILAVLNTNVHVFQVSPALTVIEKTTASKFASLFGFAGPHAGGISQPGGSASNTTSLIIARNNLFPESKTQGNTDKRFVMFTSAHGHYSLEKAAQMCGLGSDNVWTVPVNDSGQMKSVELEQLVKKAKAQGRTPFYVNATAGTTVLGSYDPFNAVADICEKHGLWMHVDGSWGGSAIFSEKQSWRLKGVERANSIAVTPHKMLGVPITCSFLLGADLRTFHKANTLPAGYLFHAEEGESNDNRDLEIWDLADLTLQCGRKGDALKLALGWIYYGKLGYEKMIDEGFLIAAYMADSIAHSPNLHLISETPPPCLQVCFYYAPSGVLCPDSKGNSKMTYDIAERLMSSGFMIDYAPGERGKFFRVVVNGRTKRETVDSLLRAIEKAGYLLQ
ncbi:MAG: hypothetical protein M1827_000163 [Pycnora praestabilis]|nr:MAG: hypothetical protein M1827_000163 [Pycnora praestabilis]